MPGSVAEPTANEWTTLEYVASTTYDYKFPEARLSVLSLNINEGGGEEEYSSHFSFLNVTYWTQV